MNVYCDLAVVGHVTPWAQASELGNGKGTHTTTSPLHTAVSLFVTSSLK